MAKGETLNHYGLVRLMVQGSGNLQLKLQALPDENGNVTVEQVLVPRTLTTTSRHPLTALANFTDTAAQLEIKTTEIDEYFILSKIIVYVKSVATSLPG